MQLGLQIPTTSDIVYSFNKHIQLDRGMAPAYVAAKRKALLSTFCYNMEVRSFTFHTAKFGKFSQQKCQPTLNGGRNQQIPHNHSHSLYNDYNKF